MRRLPVKIAPSDQRAKFASRGRISRLLGESDLLALIVVSAESLPYFLGYYNLDISLNIKDFQIAAWPTEGEPGLICRAKGPGRQPIGPFVRDIHSHTGDTSPVGHLAELITEKGWSKARWGIEEGAFLATH
jgi:hypothetical protein